MHYVRLLRPPSVDNKTRLLKLVLTITTDLGDSFLCPNDPVQIAVYLVTESVVDGDGDEGQKKNRRAQWVQLGGVDNAQGNGRNKNARKSIWSAGMRVLKLDLPLPAKMMGKTRIQIVATLDHNNNKPPSHAALQILPPDIAEIPFDTTGRILGLSVPFPSPGADICYTATRELAVRFPVGGGHDDNGGIGKEEVILQIAEEIGESIDRHVWDAGVVTTGLILDMCGVNAPGHDRWCKMPLLRWLLASGAAAKQEEERGEEKEYGQLNVIELGCGVGILGIGVARALACLRTGRENTTPAQKVPNGDNDVGNGHNGRCKDEDEGEKSTETQDTESALPKEGQNMGQVLLTDLADAEELTRANINANTQATRRDDASSFSALPLLEFEELDWENGQNGVFGPKASATRWDMVIISDCTYNVDMLSALVKTLSALHALSITLPKVSAASTPAKLVKTAGLKVMLATKPRHSSERALFDLMAADGWSILESGSQSLPLLGMEEERVEVYLFGKGDTSSGPVSTEVQYNEHVPNKRQRLG